MSSLRATLRSLLDDPPLAGQRAGARRGADAQVLVCEALPVPERTVAAIEREGQILTLPRWPEADALQPGDVVSVHVDAGDADDYCAYLERLSDAALPEAIFAPWCRDARGIHRLWCVAAARVALPDHIRVAARHDLLGIRVAQVALGFGADALAGPIEPDRTLPLAGVTRPTENTRAGLRALIEQAGLRPTMGAVTASQTAPNA